MVGQSSHQSKWWAKAAISPMVGQSSHRSNCDHGLLEVSERPYIVSFFNSSSHAGTRAQTYTHAHTYIHAYRHTHIQTHTHTYTHTYTHASHYTGETGCRAASPSQRIRHPHPIGLACTRHDRWPVLPATTSVCLWLRRRRRRGLWRGLLDFVCVCRVWAWAFMWAFETVPQFVPVIVCVCVRRPWMRATDGFFGLKLTEKVAFSQRLCMLDIVQWNAGRVFTQNFEYWTGNTRVLDFVWLFVPRSFSSCFVCKNIGLLASPRSLEKGPRDAKNTLERGAENVCVLQSTGTCNCTHHLQDDIYNKGCRTKGNPAYKVYKKKPSVKACDC